MYFCVYMFCFISTINIFVTFFTIVIRYHSNKKKCKFFKILIITSNIIENS